MHTFSITCLLYTSIRRDPTKPRTIEILDDDFALTRREVVNVPLIGTVAAGMPILAEENIEDYIPIPAELLPNKEDVYKRQGKTGSVPWEMSTSTPLRITGSFLNGMNL